jgi:hypothetical protein
MELTGKCKEDFEKWLRPDILSEHRYSELITNCFSQFPESMQYGVYVDFFDSVGVYIQLTPYFDSVTEVVLWFFTLEDKRCVHLNSHLENKAKTRPEARMLAIEKANEIYNTQKNGITRDN